jgi:gamma-glutamyl phosphate reductase
MGGISEDNDNPMNPAISVREVNVTGRQMIARVPVIKHLDGICHVYIDRDADPDKALAATVNSKTHRYGTRNTLETLLVDAPVAVTMPPAIAT